MIKLRTWWTQLWCKHHWHGIDGNLVKAFVVWECCWCLKLYAQDIGGRCGCPAPAGRRRDCWYRLYGIGLADIERMVAEDLGLQVIDEWSTPAQVAAMRKQLPAIQRVLQPYRDSGQLR